MENSETYLYETHLHTFPVSKCAKVGVRETLEFYKQAGYAGVFITNHFIDGNINVDRTLPYGDRLKFFSSDYEDARILGKEIDLQVLFGVEMSYKGTDFLVYGLAPQWYFDHPEIEDMKKSALLPYLMEQGALVIQAHPFREADYIDHIRLFPRCVHGVETYNACRTDFENAMAKQYAENYGLLPFAGSDNHVGSARPTLGGMQSPTPITDEADFVRRVKNGEMQLFQIENPLLSENKA